MLPGNSMGVLLSMRTLAEERQDGTDVLLQTSVVTDFQIVLAKYTAAMGMLLLLLALTIYLPMLVFVNGKVSWAHIGVGYLGLALFGSVEGTFMTDESRVVTAKGGMRVSF